MSVIAETWLSPGWTQNLERLRTQADLEAKKIELQTSSLKLRGVIRELYFQPDRGPIIARNLWGVPIFRDWPLDPRLDQLPQGYEARLLRDEIQLIDEMDRFGQPRIQVSYNLSGFHHLHQIECAVILVEPELKAGLVTVQGLEITDTKPLYFAYTYPINRFPSEQQEKRRDALNFNVGYFIDLLRTSQ